MEPESDSDTSYDVNAEGTRATTSLRGVETPGQKALWQLRDVVQQSRPQRFETIDELVMRLRFDLERKAQPIAYVVIADPTQGTSRLMVLAGPEATLSVERVQAQLAAEAARIPKIQPSDLDIEITMTRAEGARTAFHYLLNSPSGAVDFRYRRIKGNAIQSSPEQYQGRILKEVGLLSQSKNIDGQPIAPDQVERSLRRIGRGLYQELFSDEMRDAYREFRDKIRTLQIISNEPWIPWELICPYDDSAGKPLINDDFLCMRFEMTRWLAGPKGPQPSIRILRLVCVEAGQVPGQQPLIYASKERRYLATLAASCGALEDKSPALATSHAIGRLLDEGGVDLWHFTAHGSAGRDAPDESAILLADGYRLHAHDIDAERQTLIGQDRPLIFLNACQAGQQGWSLTRLDGWAARLVVSCRCGAFVGPLWDMNDKLAYEFACAFYDALRTSATIGQAARATRETLRQRYPTNPAWLAYNVYAHPNARVFFGASGVEPRTPDWAEPSTDQRLSGGGSAGSYRDKAYALARAGRVKDAVVILDRGLADGVSLSLTGVRGASVSREVPGELDFDAIAQAIQPGSPLVYLVTTGVGSLALIVHRVSETTGASVTSVWLDGFTATDLDSWIGVWENISQDPSFNQEPFPEWLQAVIADLLSRPGDRLIKPLVVCLRELGVGDVILVPCGRLGLLPLHALSFSLGDQDAVLLDEFDVTQVPSAGGLMVARSAATMQGNSACRFVAVAGTGATGRRLSFEGLEVNGVNAMFAAGAGRILTRDQATRTDILQTLLGITHSHFACQSIFRVRNPLDSALILAEHDALTARDVLQGRLDLSAVRLAVLSACWTDLADFRIVSDGIVGFPSVFLQAGVPGVVGTLWPGDEPSTALLMAKFYEFHLRGDPVTEEGPLPPARALRLAQRWLREVTASELADYYDAGRRKPDHMRTVSYEQASQLFRRFASIEPPTTLPFRHPVYWARYTFNGI